MRTALLALVIPVLAITLSAQEPMGGPPPGPPPDMFGGSQETPGVNSQMKRLTKLLKLSEEQKTQVRKILQEEKAQLDKLRKEQSDSDEDGPDGMEAVHKATSAKIREVLNEEQKSKFDEYEAKQQEARDQNQRDMPPPPPPF